MSTGIIDCARMEALFVSEAQPSDTLTADQVRAAVRRTVRRHGVRGCAALVAYQFGEYPEAAAARMRWAGRLVANAYVRRAPRPRRGASAGLHAA